MAAPTMNCTSCRWADLAMIEDDGELGLVCRRRPPQVVSLGTDIFATQWPVVEPGDWCGEWAEPPTAQDGAGGHGAQDAAAGKPRHVDE